MIPLPGRFLAPSPEAGNKPAPAVEVPVEHVSPFTGRRQKLERSLAQVEEWQASNQARELGSALACIERSVAEGIDEAPTGSDHAAQLDRAEQLAATEVLAELNARRAAIEQAYAEAIAAQLPELVAEQGCHARDVLCLDERGTILGSKLPASLPAGSKLSVKVILPRGDEHAGDSISLSISEEQRVSVIIEAPEPAGTSEEAGEDPCVDPIDDAEVGHHVAEHQTFTIPKQLGVIRIHLEYARTSRAGDSVHATYSSWVDHGRYYIDVGLIVPFVPLGKQRIVAAPQDGQEVLAIERDLHVTAGIAMNLFPGGRRRGELTPWSNLSCPADAGVDLSECEKRRRRRPWAELLGLQIGADLDVRDPIDQFYFGLVLEPITGVTFSGGLAVIEIDELAAGRSVGQAIITDADLEPRPRYHARGFAAFGVSLDLVQAIRAVRQRLADQRP